MNIFETLNLKYVVQNWFLSLKMVLGANLKVGKGVWRDSLVNIV